MNKKRDKYGIKSNTLFDCQCGPHCTNTRPNLAFKYDIFWSLNAHFANSDIILRRVICNCGSNVTVLNRGLCKSFFFNLLRDQACCIIMTITPVDQTLSAQQLQLLKFT